MEEGMELEINHNYIHQAQTATIQQNDKTRKHGF